MNSFVHKNAFSFLNISYNLRHVKAILLNRTIRYSMVYFFQTEFEYSSKRFAYKKSSIHTTYSLYSVPRDNIDDKK